MVIILTKGRWCNLDIEDYEKATPHKWYCSKSGQQYYVRRRKGRRHVYLHREIMQTSRFQYVCFLNGDTLDLRRCNMRNVRK